MENIKIKIRDIIQNSDAQQKFRVLYIQGAWSVLCKMEVDRLELFSIENEVLFRTLAEDKSILGSELHTVVNKSSLSESAQQAFERKKQIMQEVVSAYGPTFLELCGHKRKDELISIATKYGMTKTILWKCIRRYLQSGFDDNSLIDFRRSNGAKSAASQNKTGRAASASCATGFALTDEVRKQFGLALEYYKKGRARTIMDAYVKLCGEYYSTTEWTPYSIEKVILPESKRPSLKQFYYYCNTALSKKEKDSIKTSRREQRNNKRLLLGDNLHDILGPGDCFEMDEVEVDLSLVSDIVPNRCVGRPIVYAMVDVYTRLIVAVSVSFDNNSVLAMTNCFLNLADNKVTYCQKFGLEITENMWPSNFLPKRIRCDRGSEYRSKEAARIFNELGIARELVPAAMGSLKGSVEQLFHQMHAAQNPQLESIGLIEKRYDSRHHEEAVLNVREFTKVLLNFVITHNQSYMENYPLTKEMIAAQVKPIPLKLWEYGVKNYGMPRPISNLEQYYYALMTPVKAKISRKGVFLDGLYYMNFKDENMRRQMFEAQNKQVPIDMRMDVRDVGALYYLREDRLLSAPLNNNRTGNSEFAGVTRVDYLECRKTLLEMHRAGKEHNIQLRMARTEMNDMVIKQALPAVINTADTSDMLTSRHRERQKVENQNSISERIWEERNTGEPSADVNHSVEEQLPAITDDWETALELFK